MSSLKTLAKEHHEAMNGAFDLYRGGPRPSKSDKAKTTITTYDLSSEESLVEHQAPLMKTTSRGRRLWNEIKRLAKEHHESVNAAYTAYYGLGTYRGQAVKELGLRPAY
jgi:hypothetical protein